MKFRNTCAQNSDFIRRSKTFNSKLKWSKSLEDIMIQIKKINCGLPEEVV